MGTRSYRHRTNRTARRADRPCHVGPRHTVTPVTVLISIVIGTIVSLVVLWLVLLIGLAWLRPRGSTLRDAARIVPDTARLVHRLARDHNLGRGLRLQLFLLLAYLALPIDLVPDIIPVLGYADDVIIIGVVLRSVIRHAGPAVVRRHWPGSRDGLMVLARLCRLPEFGDDQ